MNDSQIRAALKKQKTGKHRVDNGLYFRITAEGTGFWILRYTFSKKRREYTIGPYGKRPSGIPLVDAKAKAVLLKADIAKGIDPLAERSRSKGVAFRTVDDLAQNWLIANSKDLKHPEIPARVYRKDIAPAIGELSLDRVNAIDIYHLLQSINSSGRPTVANDALNYCKQIFKHGIKLDIIKNSPAAAFTPKDAGGTEKERKRALSLKELERVLVILREHSDEFTKDNYLAFVLLVSLGVRKTELIAARWCEFSLKNRIWMIPSERTKTGESITIPLSPEVTTWFYELHKRSANSEYVFPARKKSQKSYISHDTLNHALSKLFGKQVDSYKKSKGNPMGDAEIAHFTLHDLRRTFRTLLADNGVPSEIAERCLNHKLQGVAGVYNQYDYLEERREALEQLSMQISKIA